MNTRVISTVSGLALTAIGIAACGGQSGSSTNAAATSQPVQSASAQPGQSSPPTTTSSTSSIPAAGGGSTGTTTSTTVNPPAGVFPQPTGSAATAYPTAGPTITLTPPPAPSPFSFPGDYATASHGQSTAIAAAYEGFLTDTAGLDGNFDNGWIARLHQVATNKMVHNSERVAGGFQELKYHTVGALRDSHQGIKVRGTSAVVIDCLDEVDWYLVDDKTNAPVLGSTRGDFEAFATLTKTAAGWKVNTWRPGQYKCTF